MLTIIPSNNQNSFSNTGSKEVAFVNSITSAGVVHSISKACSDGALLNCACDPTKRSGKGSDSEGEFDWTGCSDNVKFGVKFARLFIDAKESETRDARGLMNLHNNSAGRRVCLIVMVQGYVLSFEFDTMAQKGLIIVFCRQMGGGGKQECGA